MEQLKSMYETVFIVNNTIGEEAVKAVVEKFTKLITDNGEIEPSTSGACASSRIPFRT